MSQHHCSNSSSQQRSVTPHQTPGNGFAKHTGSGSRKSIYRILNTVRQLKYSDTSCLVFLTINRVIGSRGYNWWSLGMMTQCFSRDLSRTGNATMSLLHTGPHCLSRLVSGGWTLMINKEPGMSLSSLTLTGCGENISIYHFCEQTLPLLLGLGSW